jgi:hypothetical protein
MSDIAASRPPCFYLAVDCLLRTPLVSDLKCQPFNVMGYTTASSTSARLLGLSWSKMAFGAPASATKLIASIKALRSGTPEAIRRHAPCSAGSGRLRQSEALASGFLNRLRERMRLNS